MGKLIIRTNRVMLYVDVILVLLLSGTAYKVVFHDMSLLVYVLLIWHIKEVLLLLAKPKREYILFTLMVLVPMVMHFGQSTIWYLQFWLQITAIYCICVKNHWRDILEAFLNIMTFLTIESLICYSLLTSTNLGSALPVSVSSHGAKYNLLPGFVFSVGASGRNCGMFWEPGIFATMLIISLIISLLFAHQNAPKLFGKQNRKYTKRMLLFVIALFTTSSSAGIVLFGLFAILAWVVFLDVTSMSRRQMFGMVGGIVGVGLVLTQYNSILKVLGLDGNSYWSRLSSFETVTGDLRFQYLASNIEALKNNLLFGYGIKATNRIVVEGADTSTSLYILMIFGILGCVFTVSYLVRILKLKINVMARIIIAMIAIIILNKEPHLNNIMTWLLLFTLIEKKYADAKCCEVQSNQLSGNELAGNELSGDELADNERVDNDEEWNELAWEKSEWDEPEWDNQEWDKEEWEEQEWEELPWDELEWIEQKR